MIEKNLETSILLSVYEMTVMLLKKNVEFVLRAGLTNQQWVILLHLAKDPNLPFLVRENHEKPLLASELAESMGVTRANITNLLSALLGKKLIRQIEDASDRRKKRLTLTAKGEQLVASMQPARLETNRKMVKGLTKVQQKELLSYLQQCTKNIQEL